MAARRRRLRRRRAGRARACAQLYAGIERADSFIVDPHKWLFAPFDSCALIYRDPAPARAAHTQHAGYLDPVTVEGEWNPSDFAIQLTRRARGLPFWFSLAVHGTDAYRDAVEQTLAVARAGAELIRAAEHLRLLVEPDLTVLIFERIGWDDRDYAAWSARTARRAARLRHADPARRPGLHPVRDRQPAHHRGRSRADHRLDAWLGLPRVCAARTLAW